MAQIPRQPDLEAQRAAMAKLALLVGRWEGEARIYRGPSGPATAGRPTILAMTEEAQYRLDGLILVIEGIGRTATDRKTVLQALGILSFDDERGSYHLRAFNDGRFLETQVKLTEDARSSEEAKGHREAGATRMVLEWGFAVEQARTSSVLRINERGEWTEEHEIIIGNQPARRLMEVAVRRVDHAE